MARGKHGDAAARRRDGEAQRRVAELEESLRVQREVHLHQVQELKQQLANTQNRLVTEVNSLANELVENVRRECAEQLAESEREFSRRCKELGKLLKRHNVALPHGAYAEMFSILRIQPWDLLQAATDGEGTRRQKRSRARRFTGRQQELEKAINNGSMRVIRSGVITDG